MSSNASIRTLVVLATIEGAIDMVSTFHTDPVIKSKVEEAKRVCGIATNNWPVAGNGHRAHTMALKKLEVINGNFNNIWWLDYKPEMNYPGLVYVAHQMTDDLLQLISHKIRRGWLQDIYDALTILLDYVDPEGLMFLTQERAAEITKAIYSVVGDR